MNTKPGQITFMMQRLDTSSLVSLPGVIKQVKLLGECNVNDIPLC